MTTEGYVKLISYKKAFTNAWGNWNEENRKAFTSTVFSMSDKGLIQREGD